MKSLIVLACYLATASSFQLPKLLPALGRSTHTHESRRDVLHTLSTLLIGSAGAVLPANAVEAAKETPTNQAATSAGRRGCKTDSNPSRTLVECRGELRTFNSDGRLSSVSATANGVSTSAVRNPSRFSPPWTYLTETSDATVAWNSLVKAVSAADGKVEIVELTDECKYQVLAPILMLKYFCLAI